MKREEEIDLAYTDYVSTELKVDETYAIRDAFVAGAKWADDCPKGNWHNAKDELPEFGERVLIVSLFPNGYGEMRVANLFQCHNEETGEEATSWTNPVKNETVTHWMPLPQPPEED